MIHADRTHKYLSNDILGVAVYPGLTKISTPSIMMLYENINTQYHDAI